MQLHRVHAHITPTATSATFTNTHDPATDPESTTGFDMGMCLTRSTLTGTASAAPVIAATLAAAHTGTAVFIRLRVSTVYTDADTVTVALTPSATEIAQFVDSGTVSMLLTPTALEEYGTADPATVCIVYTSGVDDTSA